MASPEHRDQRHQQASKLLTELAALEASDLARTGDLSRDINFSDAVPHLQKMLDVVRGLSNRDISRLPTQQTDAIIKACTSLQSIVGEIQSFDLNVNTPGDVCEGIIQKVGNAYDEIVNPLLIPLAFTATQATDYAKIEREAKGYHATMKEEHDRLVTYLDVVKTDAENALDAVKEQAAEAGVSTNAQIFLKNSKAHAAASKSWLIATIALSAITLLAAGGFLWLAFVYTPENVAKVIQYVVSKLIVLSTLSFGIFLCAKNYRTHKHNQTLNQHRSNALQTFRAFVEGTSDDRVKDAILLHAAQAAFMPRPTGYEESDGEIQNVNPVVEVLGSALSRT